MSFILGLNKKRKSGERKKLKEKELKTNIFLSILRIILTFFLLVEHIFKY